MSCLEREGKSSHLTTYTVTSAKDISLSKYHFSLHFCLTLILQLTYFHISES